MQDSLVIAVDFDGTVAQWDKYPRIGHPVPEAIEVLKELKEAGHEIIIWTCRDEETIPDVIKWLNKRGIYPKGINKRAGQEVYSMSPKVDADLYIDDKALGCPLVYDKSSNKTYVDFSAVRTILKYRGIL